jgi:tagatose-1,6-bisphosphate aldolase
VHESRGDEEMFESQVAAACQAGASGVVVGRSCWAPDAWLASEGRARLETLARLVDDLGTLWHARPNSLAASAPSSEGWHQEY